MCRSAQRRSQPERPRRAGALLGKRVIGSRGGALSLSRGQPSIFEKAARVRPRLRTLPLRRLPMSEAGDQTDRRDPPTSKQAAPAASGRRGDKENRPTGVEKPRKKGTSTADFIRRTLDEANRQYSAQGQELRELEADPGSKVGERARRAQHLAEKRRSIFKKVAEYSVLSGGQPVCLAMHHQDGTTVQNFSVGPTQSGDVAWEGFGAAMERVGIKIGHTSGAAPIVPNVAQPAIALSAALDRSRRGAGPLNRTASM